MRLLKEVFHGLDDANLAINLKKTLSFPEQSRIFGLSCRKRKGTTCRFQGRKNCKLAFSYKIKELLRNLGMTGYYRRFCSNFSVVSLPLTRVLPKREKLV